MVEAVVNCSYLPKTHSHLKFLRIYPIQVQYQEILWFFWENPKILKCPNFEILFLVRWNMLVWWIQHMECQLKISYFKNQNALLIVINAYYRQGYFLWDFGAWKRAGGCFVLFVPGIKFKTFTIQGDTVLLNYIPGSLCLNLWLFPFCFFLKDTIFLPLN